MSELTRRDRLRRLAGCLQDGIEFVEAHDDGTFSVRLLAIIRQYADGFCDGAPDAGQEARQANALVRDIDEAIR